MREVALLDEAVGPDPLHQLIFFDDAPAQLDQDQQHLQRLLRERHHLSVAEQRALGRVEAKTVEVVEMPDLPGHR